MEEVVKEGFTRLADDSGMNDYLKDRLLGEDDPMFQQMSKKKMKIKMRSEFGELNWIVFVDFRVKSCIE